MLRSEWAEVIAAISKATRDTRTMLGWSQQRLADKAVTSQGTISRLESGHVLDLPFRSIVIVLRTLAAGMRAAELPLSPTARALDMFLQAVNPSFVLTLACESELTALIRLYHSLPESHRPAVIAFIEAAVALHERIGRRWSQDDATADFPTL